MVSLRYYIRKYEEYLQSIDSKRMSKDQFEAWLAPLVEEQKQLQQVASQSGGIIYIPVVVHVIHNGDAYGTNENITDEQVQSQITVMTQDFRRMSGTPGFNTNPVGADTQIEFVLAKVDPNGNPTNGINRVNLCQAAWSTTDIDATVKPQTIWDLFLECTRKQAYDISQEEADREVLKLEQHITAIKSFKDFYVK